MTTPRRADLDAAYRATSYFVDGPDGRFAIRVGTVSSEAGALAAKHHVMTWTYITAFNPGSAPSPRETNEARQRELEQTVVAAGLPFYRGEGKGDDGAWRPEPSLLVFGVSEEEAAALGQRFGQTAVVFGERSGPARLVWTEAPRGRE